MKTTNDNDSSDISTLDDKKPSVKISKGKIVLLLISVILFFSIISYFFFKNKNFMKNKVQKQQSEDVAPVYYLNLDELVVNLKTNEGKNTFLKISITLAFKSSEDLEFAKKSEFVIRDVYFLYLRELRSEDLRGSIATYRLKEALLKRTNKVLYPVAVDKLLFEEILVQ